MPSLFFSYTIDANREFRFEQIAVLLFCLRLVSGAEVVLFSLSQKILKQLPKKNTSKGRFIEGFLKKPKKLVASLLAANNFLNISIFLLFYVVIETIFSHINSTFFKFGLEVLLATFLIILLGAVMPKVFAGRNSLKFNLLIVSISVFLNTLLSPISLPVRSVTIYLRNKLVKQKTNFLVDQIKGVLHVKYVLPHINTNEFDDESFNFF